MFWASAKSPPLSATAPALAPCVEVLAHPGLHRRPLRAERGNGAGAADKHRYKQARGRLMQSLDMADHLVDPHRRLVAESGRQRVLAVRAPGDRHISAALGQISHRRERLADQSQKDTVRLAQYQQVAGLRDVLRRGAPMHPAPMGFAGDAASVPKPRGTIVWPVRANPSSICRQVKSNSRCAARPTSRPRALRWG